MCVGYMQTTMLFYIRDLSIHGFGDSRGSGGLELVPCGYQELTVLWGVLTIELTAALSHQSLNWFGQILN